MSLCLHLALLLVTRKSPSLNKAQEKDFLEVKAQEKKENSLGMYVCSSIQHLGSFRWIYSR